MEKDFDTWNNKKRELERKNFTDFVHTRDVWWCSLGLNLGSEQDGKNDLFERPVLIIKKFNRDNVLVVPITSSVRKTLYHITFRHLSKDYSAVISQIRLVSTKRFNKFMYQMDSSLFQYVCENVAAMFLENKRPLGREVFYPSSVFTDPEAHAHSESIIPTENLASTSASGYSGSMNSPQEKLFKLAADIIIKRNGKILLGKRKGGRGDGRWALPGGHLEYGEHLANAARRELKEETGMTADSFVLRSVVNSAPRESNQYVLFGFDAINPQGEPQLCEPDRCYEWKWFDIHDLPQEIFEPHRGHFELLKNGQNLFEN